MDIEKITVRATQSGQTMEVVVFSKRAHRIEVVLGEGVHSVKCELTPTRNGSAYAGSVLGREIVYERSREQVQAEPCVAQIQAALSRASGSMLRTERLAQTRSAFSDEALAVFAKAHREIAASASAQRS